ncbi:uncharacterized protein K489DRAFT_393407 [Dissoconium aciculare CBS 342.82]|uniref:C2 domain-containing protein n=1 Tax=Dissoconium aciculare CBS 342.82 TaxID=1314786 RepID=A0A6J3MCY3_9PEZI|nr:uncharacterized protein K489DRAFT_393407 [Dissoconium aciculare CBS 342.82]KAF1825738.1 hypothetical protein K489DRAFT_393407 [Dissoconium aciculare CBS 342.82]
MAAMASLSGGQHSAGIFADMSIDGPEIGTLVLIVDRGKNLPNRKAMGKQNCYCAARLGKEARKTETDKRGGQTPRWDQELRFTVHDSPDYYNLKISVFSEDKRTDLIGEAWVDLNEVIVPGGGKNDLWQALTFKGKYAGELRVELTYYDTRQKPEKMEVLSVADELREAYGTLAGPKVKRRPLPTNPNVPSTTPVVIPERALPGRAKHGPRDLTNPQRAQSLPPDSLSYPYSSNTLVGHSPAAPQPGPNPHYGSQDQQQPAHPAPRPQQFQPVPHTSWEQAHAAPSHEAQHGYMEPASFEADPRGAEPDFLPQLPPSQRQRASLPQQPRYAQQPTQQPYHAQHAPQPRPQSHTNLPHTHSAPAVPTGHFEDHRQEAEYAPSRDHAASVPNMDYQHQPTDQRRGSYIPEEVDAYGYPQSDGNHYPEQHAAAAPPPPPVHVHASPSVPHHSHAHPHTTTPSRYSTAPNDGRQQYARSPSPLPIAEPEYEYQQTPPPRNQQYGGQSYDSYHPSPNQQSYDNSPVYQSPQAPSPYGRTPPAKAGPQRLSMADPYSTPPRPHPLSQEVQRPVHHATYPGTRPQQDQSADGQRAYQHPDHQREVAPIVKPRAISPAPAPAPVSAPTSAPPSTSRQRPSTYSMQFPVRAFESSDQSPLSTSQRTPNHATPIRKSVSPRPSFSTSPAIPYSPDSYDHHQPSLPKPGADDPTPIVGWHGQEIDPSDHLPVGSWAPEPEKKNTPTKTYGLGRDREFGPRAAQPGSGARLSKDTVVNIRMKDRSGGPDSSPAASPGHNDVFQDNSTRNRLFKRAGPPPDHRHSAIEVSSRDRHSNFAPVPNPYEQQQQQSPQQYDRHYQGSGPDEYGANSGAPPMRPPKVPMESQPAQNQMQLHQDRRSPLPHSHSPHAHPQPSSSPAYHHPPPQPQYQQQQNYDQAPARQYDHQYDNRSPQQHQTQHYDRHAHPQSDPNMYQQRPVSSYDYSSAPVQQQIAQGSSHDALSREISAIDLGPSRNRGGSTGPNGAAPGPPTFVPVRSHRDRNSYY